MKIYKTLYIGFVLFTTLSFSSCSDYFRVQKSNNPSLKYDYAKKYYNLEKWDKASSLLVDIIPSYSGTSEGPQALYMFANSELQRKNYETAAEAFRQYYRNYPKGQQVEAARYKAGLALYSFSPEARLDQAITYTALQELQSFLDYHKNSKYNKEVKRMLFDLQDKLAYKEYLSAKLYFDLGTYLGNNYKSAIITAKNTLKSFPYSKNREDLLFLILKASYKEAIISSENVQAKRLRGVIDNYYTYTSEFSNGKFSKEAEKIYKKTSSLIKKENK